MCSETRAGPVPVVSRGEGNPGTSPPRTRRDPASHCRLPGGTLRSVPCLGRRHSEPETTDVSSRVTSLPLDSWIQ